MSVVCRNCIYATWTSVQEKSEVVTYFCCGLGQFTKTKKWEKLREECNSWKEGREKVSEEKYNWIVENQREKEKICKLPRKFIERSSSTETRERMLRDAVEV